MWKASRLLGGKDNHAADRAVIEAVLAVNPEMAFTARANRAFLGRLIRDLAADTGIRQFLDIGTGIPMAGNSPVPAATDRMTPPGCQRRRVCSHSASSPARVEADDLIDGPRHG